MLRNGNLGLKMGVSRVAHNYTKYAYIWKYPPPPPGVYSFVAKWLVENTAKQYGKRKGLSTNHHLIQLLHEINTECSVHV